MTELNLADEIDEMIREGLLWCSDRNNVYSTIDKLIESAAVPDIRSGVEYIKTLNEVISEKWDKELAKRITLADVIHLLPPGNTDN